MARPNHFPAVVGGCLVLHGSVGDFRRRICGFKLWMLESLNLQHQNRRRRWTSEFNSSINQDKDQSADHCGSNSSNEGQVSGGTSALNLSNG